MPLTCQNMRDDNAQRFEQLKSALKNVGFSKRYVVLTCQLIMPPHISSFEFTIDRGRDVDTAVVATRIPWPWSPTSRCYPFGLGDGTLIQDQTCQERVVHNFLRPGWCNRPQRSGKDALSSTLFMAQ